MAPRPMRLTKFTRGRSAARDHLCKAFEVERADREAQLSLKLFEARPVEHDWLVRLVRRRGQQNEVPLNIRARCLNALARHKPRDDNLRTEVTILNRRDLQARSESLVHPA